MKMNCILILILLFTVSGLMPLQASGTVWSEVKDNVAYVYHDNAEFNCCNDFFTWSEHDSSDYFVINIYELDTLHECNCTCFYDFHYIFAGLEPGTYTAKVWEAPYETYSLAGTSEFVIPVQTGSPGTSSSVSECHMEPGVTEREGSYSIDLRNLSFAPVEISYSLPEPMSVSISIFDVSGREVYTLAEGQMESGVHTLTWDSRDEQGLFVPRGVYHVRLTTPKFTKMLSLVILR